MTSVALWVKCGKVSESMLGRCWRELEDVESPDLAAWVAKLGRRAAG